MVNSRVIYDQDSTNLFRITPGPILPEDVNRMVDEVSSGGADTMLLNPNAQKINYPGTAWEKFWDGYEYGDMSFFSSGGVNIYLEERAHTITQMKRFAEAGHDYLEIALTRCRRRGMTPGITVRMNDMHDAPWPESNFHSSFYRNNPRYRLPGPLASGWGRVALNYEFKPVRDHYLVLIRELVHKYDFDILSLDFMRFPNYFLKENFDRHCEIMTGFIQNVRDLTLGAGRVIKLMGRVHATPALAFEQGFDVAALAKKGIVDGIACSQYFSTAWDMPVDAFRELAGSKVKIYACADYEAARRKGLPPRFMPLEPGLVRGFSAGYRALGADGIYLFNYFRSREATNPREPEFSVLKEASSMRTLKGAPKVYLTTAAGDRAADSDMPEQFPVVIAPGSSRKFEMLLAEENENTAVYLDVIFDGQSAPGNLWLSFNHRPAGLPKEVLDLPCAEGIPLKAARFSIPPSCLRNGRNHIFIRNEGPGITASGIDVLIP